jgi:hypothetical protein
MDMVETYRELAAGLMDVYLSAVSNRMNEVMKLLTVISAIFIPLTFIAGVYGMNFKSEKSPHKSPNSGGLPERSFPQNWGLGGLTEPYWERCALVGSPDVKSATRHPQIRVLLAQEMLTDLCIHGRTKVRGG